MQKIQLIKKVDALLGRCLAGLLPRPRFLQSSKVHRILIIRPGGIGDAILLIPSILLLKSKYPHADIDLLAEKRNAGAFKLCDGVSSVYRYDRVTELSRVLLRRYDVVIDTEQWYRLSAVIARLVRSGMKVGFATNERKRMLTHAFDYSQGTYETDSFLSLLEPLEVAQEWGEEGAFLNISVADRDRAGQMLAGINGPFVALFPGGSVKEKRWPVERFAAVAVALRGRGYAVVVVGASDDVAAGERIVADCSGINLAGRTSLVQTAAVLEKANLLISGDSGVLHMGVASGVATVSLFGPSAKTKWSPRGPRHRVINNDLLCSPCTLFGNVPPCSIGGRCIVEITADEVLTAALQLLPIEIDGVVTD